MHNGRCVCPTFTEGAHCGRCAPGAWNYDPVNGCQVRYCAFKIIREYCCYECIWEKTISRNVNAINKAVELISVVRMMVSVTVALVLVVTNVKRAPQVITVFLGVDLAHVILLVVIRRLAPEIVAYAIIRASVIVK